MECSLCGKEPRGRRLARGLCSSCAVELTIRGLYDSFVEGVADPERSRTMTPDGYVMINGILEHRLVMEQVLGRRLIASENVHHKDGDRTNNRPDNLELWKTCQPSGQRVEDLIKYVAEHHADRVRSLIGYDRV